MYLQYRKYCPNFGRPSNCLYVLQEAPDTSIFQQEIDNDRINPSCVSDAEYCGPFNNMV